jgi:CheY-like chemotaxis protein
MLRRDPRTEAVPVVVVSADATPGHADRLRGEGAQEYLTKPLEVRRLLEVLRGHLPTAQAVSRDGPRPGQRPGGRGPSPTTSG